MHLLAVRTGFSQDPGYAEVFRREVFRRRSLGLMVRAVTIGLHRFGGNSVALEYPTTRSLRVAPALLRQEGHRLSVAPRHQRRRLSRQ